MTTENGTTVSLPVFSSILDSQRDSLTAAQIGDVLQQRPELVVELKSLLADESQQRGGNTLADSITDEQLFHQIAISIAFRSNVTTWLLARGYVTQADIHRSTAEAQGDDSASRFTDPNLDLLTPQLPGGTNQQIPTEVPFDTPPSTTRPSLASAPRVPIHPSARTAAPPPTPNITDEPEARRQPTPYNLLAMRDLYTQVPQETKQLKRFGSDVFLTRDLSDPPQSNLGQRQMPVDVPIGPDYILGVGDNIVINLWGGISQSLTRTIDREGKIVLPEAGSLVIAGLSLERAQTVVASALKQQFRNARADVTIARLRTVRVYVVGDVQRPGAYDVSSLSTPLNALYAAGGPTATGSLRIIRHYRGQRLIREVDLYDFLLHGLRMDDERLASGDTLLVPPAGPQAAVFGAVKRPAIYELKGEETLAATLDDAGGATVAAALNHITIERIQPNQMRETVTLEQPSNSLPEATLRSIATFKVKDGDRIHVAPILPYSERSIYLEGHIARPGKYPYRDGMQLSDVLHSYQDLLPEPAPKGDIVRLVPPDLHAETIQFDVADTLIGNPTPLLQPFDTIHVYGRYEVDSPKVTIRGEVLRPGTYAMSEGMSAAKRTSPVIPRSMVELL
jgi:protein involved in polysaccharide export with SLBB domain